MIARGWRLKELMTSRGIGSGRALHRRLLERGEDVSYVQLSRLVSGNFEAIRVVFLRELCLALNCEPNDLFDFEGVTPLTSIRPVKKPATRYVGKGAGSIGKLGEIRLVGLPLVNPLDAGRRRRGG
jgi:DNA-binding Xre family transcriptional regulator